MSNPNITYEVELPADFEQEATRQGYTLKKYIWLLAEDACANPPAFVQEEVTQPPPSDSSEAVENLDGDEESSVQSSPD